MRSHFIPKSTYCKVVAHILAAAASYLSAKLIAKLTASGSFLPLPVSNSNSNSHPSPPNS